MTTAAFIRAKPIAVALPMPVLEPVTMQILPLSRWLGEVIGLMIG
jgi:hypothetical protein